MKVLFICQRNNGRSQIAKGIYNALTDTNDADAAGLTVDNDGQLLSERAKESGSDVGKVIEVMSEVDIDVSGSARRQFDKNKLDEYDKVIALLEDAKVPSELRNNPKVTTWNVSDPKTKDLEGVRQTRNEIEVKIKELVLLT